MCARRWRASTDEAFAAATLAQVEALRRYLRDARDPAALADVGDAPAIGFHSRPAVEGIVEARRAQ
ncbi:MAG TPA: hypothetical protein VFW96_25740 [Thermomicrobiales bacterium]|nr:hypothetical protein [Thermomicrobiales bacterium]